MKIGYNKDMKIYLLPSYVWPHQNHAGRFKACLP